MRLTLFKRGHVWWVRGSEGGHKFRRSTRQVSAALARRVRDRLEREFADPAHSAAHRATVASAAERFMKELRQSARSQNTVRFYDVKVRHVVRLLGHVNLHALTHERVVDFITKRTAKPPEGEGAHQYSVHRELTALRRILKSASRAREFVGDWKAVLPEYATGYVPKTDWVTPADVWAAIRQLPRIRGATVAFSIATANDFSSLFTARPEDIRPTKVIVRGTKTTARMREVPRVGIFDEFLKYAIDHADSGEFLFPAWGSMPRDLRAACRRAGVPEFTSRTLRRSAATWMVTSGVPYEIAAKFLGHKSTTMLQKVYGQVAAEDAGRMIGERMAPFYAVSLVDPATPKQPDSADSADSGTTQNHGKDDAS